MYVGRVRNPMSFIDRKTTKRHEKRANRQTGKQ